MVEPAGGLGERGRCADAAVGAGRERRALDRLDGRPHGPPEERRRRSPPPRPDHAAHDSVAPRAEHLAERERLRHVAAPLALDREQHAERAGRGGPHRSTATGGVAARSSAGGRGGRTVRRGGTHPARPSPAASNAATSLVEGGAAERPGPPDDLEASVVVLDEGRAVLDPVAAVGVERPPGVGLDEPQLGPVDVAAHDAVDAALGGPRRDGLLEPGHVLERPLRPVLERRRQRPVRVAQPLARRGDDRVQRERRLVGPRADPAQPRREAHDAVELVAVQDQEPPAVGERVHVVTSDEDTAEREARELARRVVVVARHVDHLGPLPHLPEQLLDHVVLGLRPGPRPRQRPPVHDVADEHPALGVVLAEEVEHAPGLAAAHAQVEVG